jgi:hypothetical protein
MHNMRQLAVNLNSPFCFCAPAAAAGFVGNPPWQVSPELYQELLLPAGFEQLELTQIPPHLSHKGRGGREWFARWWRIDVQGGSSREADTEAAVGDASTHSSSTTVSRM